MEELKDRLEDHLVRFTDMLRKQGVKAGTSELQEALLALRYIDPLCKTSFKSALKATLVKKPSELEVFEKTFNRYFVPATEKEKQLEKGWEKEANYREKKKMAEEELKFKEQQLNLKEEEKMVYASLASRDREKIKSFIRDSEQGKKVDASFKPLIESLVKSTLRYRKERVSHVERRPEPVTGDPGWDWMLSSPEPGNNSSASRLLNSDFKDIAEKDIPRVVELSRKISMKLAKILSRRYKLTYKKKKLDMRKILRENISYGGYLVKLKYGHKKKKKLRLLVLGDVSGSMDRYSSFVMTFIYGLSWAVKEVECFVFAEGTSRMTSCFKKGLSFEEVMNRVMQKRVEWGKGTNLAQALERICLDYPGWLNSRTLVIVVSDTRTTHLEDSLQKLQFIKSRVKDVLWLNPLPASQWEEFSSVEKFQHSALMYPCSCLADLEEVFRYNMKI